MGLPKVSVVLVNFRGIDDTLNAIKSIQETNYPKELTEIVVVDNASGDNSVEALKKSMNLSKYAKYNIILNSGGGLALGLGFENVIGLCGTISSVYNMFDYSLSQIFHPPSQINNFLIAIAQNISSLKVDLLNPEVC